MTAKGGITIGKSHSEGGIPLEVKSTGQKVELEGGEGVINKRSMSDKTLHNFDGKNLTKCQIASKINSDKNFGVKINCDNTFESGGSIENNLSDYVKFKKGGGVIDNVIESRNLGDYSDALENLIDKTPYSIEEIYPDYDEKIEYKLDEVQDNIDSEQKIFQKNLLNKIKTENDIIELKSLLEISSGNSKKQLNNQIKELQSSLFEKGGKIDLFEQYDKQPKGLSKIVEKYDKRYADGYMDYTTTKDFLAEVNAIGFTFEYGLDNEPYNLHKMANGGRVYKHKHIPTMTFEITGDTINGYKGIQKDKKSASRLERTKGKKVSYSLSDLKDLFTKVNYAKGGDVGFNEDMEAESYVKSVIKNSDFYELGDGYSSSFKNSTNKKGDKTNGEYTLEGKQIFWTYIDSKGREYSSDEQPAIRLDMRNYIKKDKYAKGGTIECGSCNWSWNRADGGDDMYVCHKCNTDNTSLYKKGGATKSKNEIIIEITKSNKYPVYIGKKYNGTIVLSKGDILDVEFLMKFKKEKDVFMKYNNYNLLLNESDFIFHSKKQFASGGFIKKSENSVLNELSDLDIQITNQILDYKEKELTVKQKLNLQRFKGNNVVNYLGENTANKIWGAFYKYKPTDLFIKNIYLINSGIGLPISYASLGEHIYIDMSSNSNSLENIERSINNIINKDKNWEYSTDKEALNNCNSAIIFDPEIDPTENIATKLLLNNNLMMYAVSVSEFSNSTNLNNYFINSLNANTSITYKKLIINQGIVKNEGLTAILIYIKNI